MITRLVLLHLLHLLAVHVNLIPNHAQAQVQAQVQVQLARNQVLVPVNVHLHHQQVPNHLVTGVKENGKYSIKKILVF